jgi:hypothetical protein
VLVGPNNSGKSRTLQEVMMLAQHNLGPQFQRGGLVVLEGYRTEKLLDVEGASDWLSTNRFTTIAEPGTQRRSVRAIGFGDFLLERVEQFWSHDEHFGELALQLFRLIGPGEGRGMLGQPGRLGPRQLPDHAVQTLVRNQTTRRAFENAFRSAFGYNLIVDSWLSNTVIRLSRTQVQGDFAYESTDGLPSDELADRLAALPTVDAQSDGIRAFAGLLLTLITVRHPILMLDEPETFLHPPQARLLGEYLARLRGDGQLFIATHSLDILLGLLQQSAARVLVVRLSRRDERTAALVVDPNAVRGLWRDPLLRFSRALDGLFHEGVVVCEGDTDSQFYSAVSYHLARQRTDATASTGASTSNEATPHKNGAATEEPLPEFSANPFDVMFTYVGGKQRIKMISSALSAVRVPVRCIVDFDGLNDEATLRELVKSLGHDYPVELEQMRRLVDAGIRGQHAAPTVGRARAAIEQALSGRDEAPIDTAITSAISAALEPPAGWAAAKKKGRAEVPAGDATVALDSLLSALRQRGIFVVPTGAVESWVKSAAHRSTAWVVDVIEKNLIELATEAQAFVNDVLGSLAVR